MAMKRSGAGGGPNSNKVVRPSYRQGQQRERVIPAGAAQLGQRQGNHITDGGSTRYGGVPLIGGTGLRSELGNAKAVATICGPGGSRTIYKTGFQTQTGAANPGQPMTPRGEIFPGFGPKR
jgi:hypothetical protein